MKRVISLLLAALMVTSFGMTAMAAEFTDIAGSSAVDAIIKLADNGYVSGYGDGTFKPDNPITRAEFATLLSKFGASAGITYTGFDDVSGEDWFAVYVENAVSRGFVSGYPDGTYRPNNNISRYEVIKVVSMMVRYDAYISVQLPYSDANSFPTWVSNHVRNLYGAGVIGAYADNTLNGDTAVTRAEVVLMLSRTLDLYGWSQAALTDKVAENIRNPFPVPADMPYEIIGYLTIPSIGLKDNPCRDGATLANMKISIAHYAETSIWDGNIGLCAHNQDYTYDFRNLNKVSIGDEVIYRTRFGTRHYRVDIKIEIADDDWSYLGKYSNVNKITMTTCVKGVPGKRLCVQATEIQ